MRAALLACSMFAVLGCGSAVVRGPDSGAVPGEGCPSSVEPGTSCSTKGTVCFMAYDNCPEDQDMLCTCDGQHFDCGITMPSCSPCPPSADVVPGASCSLRGTTSQCLGESPDCDGGVVSTQCLCEGTWQCDAPVCGGVDAGAD